MMIGMRNIRKRGTAEMFEIQLGEKEIPKGMEVIERIAVRGIVWDGNKLLMVQTNKGDYKFPGGGMDSGESYEETLRREIMEETGYQIISIGEKLGQVIHQRVDTYDVSKFFCMKSIYYECTVNMGNRGKQKLDDYENEQEFTPKFVDMDAVMLQNENVQRENNTNMNDWVLRETKVLQFLRVQLGAINLI